MKYIITDLIHFTKYYIYLSLRGNSHFTRAKRKQIFIVTQDPLRTWCLQHFLPLTFLNKWLKSFLLLILMPLTTASFVLYRTGTTFLLDTVKFVLMAHAHNLYASSCFSLKYKIVCKGQQRWGKLHISVNSQDQVAFKWLWFAAIQTYVHVSHVMA